MARDQLLIDNDIASLDELAIRTARAIRKFTDEDVLDETLAYRAREAKDLLNTRLPSWGATLRAAMVERRRLGTTGQASTDGLMLSPDILKQLRDQFGPDHLWSASQINDYGTCPFRFFARHVLRLQEAAEPQEGFASNQLGNAYHRILERLYKMLQESGIALSRETVEQAMLLVDEAAENILEEITGSDEVCKGALWEFEKREIKRRIARLIQKEAEWNCEAVARPLYFERKFGMGGEPPLVIKSN